MHKDSVLAPGAALLAAVVCLAGCGAAVDSIASDDLQGTTAHCFQDIAMDDFQPIEFNAGRLLVEGPSVIGFEGARAIIEFGTSVPTPAAVIRFGPITLAGGVREALFRKVAGERLESGETATVHRIEVDVSRLESSSYDLHYIEDGGGEVAYRLEVYDPRWGSAGLYDRRFRYTRDGPRKTGEYALASTLTFGPFIDLVGPDSFVVSWETDTPAAGAVVLGDTVVLDPNVALTHEVAVDGLRPYTDYEYRVRYGPDDALAGPFRVRTAPEDGAVGCRFAYASDSRGGAGGCEHCCSAATSSTATRRRRRPFGPSWIRGRGRQAQSRSRCPSTRAWATTSSSETICRRRSPGIRTTGSSSIAIARGRRVSSPCSRASSRI